MKKHYSKLIFMGLIICPMVVCCGGNDNPQDPVVNPLAPFTDVLQDATFSYDGTEHVLEFESVPEGYTVTYYNNKKTEVGRYDVTAVIEGTDGSSRFCMAKLIIDKADSVLTADTYYESYGVFGGITPTYSLNNEEQSINVPTYTAPGTYTLDLFAPATKNYKESNHVNVTVRILEGNPANISFPSKTFVYDGTEKTIEADTSNIAAGYTVQYKNNKATEPGKYRATCEILRDGAHFLDCNAILIIDNPDYEPFEDYCDEFFLDYLGDDFCAWNTFAEDPANFGYTRDPEVKAKWYTYDGSFTDPNYVSEYYTEDLGYYDMLKEFDDKPLSNRQRVAYRAIDEFFYLDIDKVAPEKNYSPYMEMYYIDQFGGYASVLNSELEGYHIRVEQDIIDILDYIKSAPAAFESYIQFATEKTQAGYPFSDYTLNECIKFVDESLDYEGDDYYLIGLLQDKIDASNLADGLKTTYKASVSQYIKSYLEPAYEKFADDLEQFKGTCPKAKELYYGAWENGPAYYLNSLKNRIGSRDVTLDSFKEEVAAACKKWVDVYFGSQMMNLQDDESKAIYRKISKGTTPIVSGLTEPLDMIEFLKEFADTIVEPLDNDPEIVIKHMSEAEQNSSNAVAYYTKSTLDSDPTEYITLNDKLIGDYNSTLETIAHEGYPGHLYEFVHSKSLGLHNIANLMTSTAHGEGWATYVAYKLWEYLPTIYEGTGVAGVQKYCTEEQAYSVFAYLLYTYVDLLLNGFQYTRDQIGKEVNNIGLNDSFLDELIPLLVEIPGEYASYGYGQYIFVKLHDDAREALGDFYNEINFNKAILSEGWCSIERVKELAEEYILDTAFINNIDLTK